MASSYFIIIILRQQNMKNGRQCPTLGVAHSSFASMLTHIELLTLCVYKIYIHGNNIITLLFLPKFQAGNIELRMFRRWFMFHMHAKEGHFQLCIIFILFLREHSHKRVGGFPSLKLMDINQLRHFSLATMEHVLTSFKQNLVITNGIMHIKYIFYL